ncbi:hypothetical protein [Labrenzia sp. R5_0]|jgi:hypothetical protein|uniref:hypothetical protein n=1 Tax=Labrenzia sp. R5_0 TaxID=2821108 RepID=UPI001ADD49B0|nr:hypothetical protein [Labrenzia sp. R5_0]MBO9460978.1 hypothetical protein [Labrenzia sp. R5_0]
MARFHRFSCIAILALVLGPSPFVVEASKAQSTETLHSGEVGDAQTKASIQNVVVSAWGKMDKLPNNLSCPDYDERLANTTSRANGKFEFKITPSKKYFSVQYCHEKYYTRNDPVQVNEIEKLSPSPALLLPRENINSEDELKSTYDNEVRSSVLDFLNSMSYLWVSNPELFQITVKRFTDDLKENGEAQRAELVQAVSEVTEKWLQPN